MKEDRESFIFHKDWYNAISQLDKDLRLELYDAIMRKALYNEPPSLSPMGNLAMSFIEHQIERDFDKWLDIREKRSNAGKSHKGNQYKKVEQMEHNQTNGTSVPMLEQTEQDGTNGTVSVSVSVSDNVSVDNTNAILKEEENTNVFPKKNDYQAIVDCWNEHNGKKLGKVTKVTERRKKAIKKALDDNGITQEQLMLFFKTLPLADKWLYNPNKQHANWKPDFDWWLSNPNGWLTKGLEGKVHLENPQAYSSIMLGKDAPYTPLTDGALSWNDYYSSFIFVGYWDGVHIPDGYTDETRPNGATIMLNNGRGNITWNKNTKQWERV